jgi:hypothetical protein
VDLGKHDRTSVPFAASYDCSPKSVCSTQPVCHAFVRALSEPLRHRHFLCLCDRLANRLTVVVSHQRGLELRVLVRLCDSALVADAGGLELCFCDELANRLSVVVAHRRGFELPVLVRLCNSSLVSYAGGLAFSQRQCLRDGHHLE